jgi:hypothetical protein
MAEGKRCIECDAKMDDDDPFDICEDCQNEQDEEEEEEE